ncbi:AAA family ATPase [Ureibacillus thermophilus]|uniref:Nuclease SbcCD subunit C n=1 Tax=Ureibacillus thermophilus TaxID=367743 RepID=A0A4P6UXQ4_9BACL|nr:AAA family ATPase [Ureibacillus thermophilus]QBK26998.1 SMC family ATPase [Ureibacillus thermophilus]
MKPILLKMTAFGPYKDEEVIDFTKLEEKKLFVISGQTGAGKTTIFDAICFALYGCASGQDRKEPKMLRSDFADDDVHTAVEFIFEIRGKKYRVLRRLPHVKKGRKTATGEKYELFEVLPNNEEIPAVERQRVSEINQKLEELIGLTYDQFCQIVMLPQGEFRKLLTSKSDEKEEILRKIFRTERFIQMADKLEEKKRAMDQQLNEASALKNSYISQIEGALPKRESALFLALSQNSNIYQILEGLAEEQQYYQEKIKEDDQRYREAFNLHKEKYEVYVANKKLNDEIEIFEMKKDQLLRLQSQSAHYEQVKETIDAANRASRISPIYSQLLELEKEKTELEKKRLGVEKQLEEANQILVEAKERYEQEAEKENERERTNERVKELENLVPIYEQMNEQSVLVEKLWAEQNQLQSHIQLLERQLAEKTAAALELSKKIEKLEEATETYNELLEEERRLKEIADAFSKYHETKSKIQKLEDEYKNANETYTNIHEIYAKEEEKWLNNQAAILAANLKPGMPCPVCGSTEHSIQHKETIEIIEQDELKKLRAALDEAQKHKFAVQGQLESKRQQLSEIEEIFITLNAPIAEEEKFINELQTIQNKVKVVEGQKEELSSSKKHLKRLQEAKEQVEKLQKESAQKYNEVHEKYTKEKTILEQQKKSIPEEIHDLSQLKTALQEAIRLKGQLKESWERAQIAYQEASKQIAAVEEAFKQTTEQADHIQRKVQKVKEAFLSALKEAQFASTEEFLQAQLSPQKIESLQKQYEDYSKQLHSLETQVREGEEKLKGKEKVDLTEAERELKVLQSNYEKALDALNHSKACEKHCIDFAEKLEQVASDIFRMEEKSNQIIDLYNLLRGQNSKKISFERYVQMGYLELITEASNLRLKNLSNGQYYLQVSDRVESYGRASGLGLDVYDTYTGQTRDVKTLSGGEKFNASLSLALGMADVIQSYQGNVNIETMFIDEGFGSLDEESLMKAIDTLIELQKSGRMIGVISHVEELKSAMPAVLHVEKLKEGYSKTTILLK